MGRGLGHARRPPAHVPPEWIARPFPDWLRFPSMPLCPAIDAQRLRAERSGDPRACPTVPSAWSGRPANRAGEPEAARRAPWLRAGELGAMRLGGIRAAACGKPWPAGSRSAVGSASPPPSWASRARAAPPSSLTRPCVSTQAQARMLVFGGMAAPVSGPVITFFPALAIRPFRSEPPR